MRSTPLAVALCCLAIACGRTSDDTGKVDTSLTVSMAPPVMPAGNEDKSPCPHTGRWALCSVEQRLRQSGFVLKPVSGTPSMRAGFSVTPAVYSVGRAHLEVFIYADEAALSRDIAKLDTLRVAPPGVNPTWDGTPLLIRSGNLAAVYVGDNPRQSERISLALTAGAPQPGSPR